MSSTFRYLVLSFLLCIEITLFLSFRSSGWNSTVASLFWLASATFVAIPIIVGLIIFWSSGKRIRLASLFHVVTLIAIFLAIAVAPFYRAKNARLGSLAMASSGADVVTVSSYPDYATNIEHPLPRWLRPLLGNQLAVPTDDTVCGVNLTSDFQIAEFCKNVGRFPKLRNLSLHGSGITNQGMGQLKQIGSKLDNLESLIVGNAQLQAGVIDGFPSLRSLWVYTEETAGKQLRITKSFLADVAHMGELESLEVWGYGITDAEVGVLGESSSLKQINLINTQVTAARVQELDIAMPHCVVCRSSSE